MQFPPQAIRSRDWGEHLAASWSGVGRCRSLDYRPLDLGVSRGRTEGLTLIYIDPAISPRSGFIVERKYIDGLREFHHRSSAYFQPYKLDGGAIDGRQCLPMQGVPREPFKYRELPQYHSARSFWEHSFSGGFNSLVFNRFWRHGDYR
jgi:hypothetical protein